MQFTKHAIQNIPAKAASFGLTPAQMNAAIIDTVTNPAVRYESRRGGGFRHIKNDLVVLFDRDTVITFYKNIEETPLRADQTDADALAHAQKVNAQKTSQAARAQAKNARRDRDRALTAAQKGKK